MVDQLNTAQRDQPVEPAVIELPSKVTTVNRPAVNQVPAIAAFRRLSLKTKATVLAIAIGTLPVLGIGAIAYSFANRSITKQIISAEETLATTLSQRVTSFMAERTADMQILSNLPILTIPNIRDTVSQDDKRGLLERFVEANAVYDSVALFDLNGNVVFQNDRSNISSQGDQDYFRAALQSNRVSISRPVRAENGEFVVYITAPVQESGSNRRTGIIRAEQEQERADRLAAKLRELGIDPDQLAE
jgi:methyl-accepting chemotaxis protein PixJ